MKKPIRTRKTCSAASASSVRTPARRTPDHAPSFSSRLGSVEWSAAELLACLLTVLLPVKFSSIVSVPEVGALYWSDPFSLLIISWPLPVFMIASSILLALTVPAALSRTDMTLCPPLLKYGGLWFVLGCVSFPGLADASCMGYPRQMIAHTLSLASYAISLSILLSGRREFARMLTGALALGGVLSILSGLYQYYYGFEALREHVQAQTAAGRGIDRNMDIRIREARLQADFSSCNVYGAYLAGLLPFLTALFWRFGNERVTPPKLSRRLFGGGALAVMLFLLVKTDSRGAFFSLLAAGAVVFFFSGLPRKWKLAGAGLLLLGAAGLAAMIAFGRGALSMYVRLDYVQSAGRMMLKHPLTGTGWGDFYHDYPILRLWHDKETPHSPHNMVMLFGSQCGIAGFAAALAVLAYPVFAVCRQAWWTVWRSPADYFALVPGISCLILSAGILLDVGFETAAYSGVLIVFSLLVLMHDAPAVDYPRTPSHCAAILLLMVPAALSCWHSKQVFLEERAFSALLHELNPQYSFEHQDDPGYKPTPDRVEALLKEAVKAAPRSPFPWNAASDYMFMTGRPETALEYLNRSIELDPLQSANYVKRARMLFAFAGMNVTDEVRRDLETARRLAPKNPELNRPDGEICIEAFISKESLP